tara:strand:+ start:10304 stop:11167 length:864 start_codon:yes stop_codon:yes gene_type:complete
MANNDMRLILNNTEIETTLCDNNFVDWWTNTVFKNSNEVSIITADYSLDNYKARRYDLLNKYNNLIDILSDVNEVIARLELNKISDLDISLFDTHEGHTNDFIRKTHMHWAYIEKQLLDISFKVEWWPELNKNHQFTKINNRCHFCEFTYTDIHVQFDIPTMSYFQNADYKIKLEDTSFNRAGITLPYSDIGRPPFESWAAHNEINHEASNYINLVNAISVQSNTNAGTTPPPHYIEYCENNGVVPYGPYVNIASGGKLDEQYLTMGSLIINALNLEDNNICKLIND